MSAAYSPQETSILFLIENPYGQSILKLCGIIFSTLCWWKHAQICARICKYIYKYALFYTYTHVLMYGCVRTSVPYAIFNYQVSAFFMILIQMYINEDRKCTCQCKLLSDKHSHCFIVWFYSLILQLSPFNTPNSQQNLTLTNAYDFLSFLLNCRKNA
jgi:hypothetical protein